jgi:hypothetical protein
MKLNYSYNTIEPHWFPGDLPFSDVGSKRVIVNLKGRSSSEFPPFAETGELLTYRPTGRSAVTLLLTYKCGNVPPSNAPPPVGVWHPVPGSPVLGQIRIALPPEAVNQIRHVTDADHDYTLTLENVELIDVTQH